MNAFIYLTILSSIVMGFSCTSEIENRIIEEDLELYNDLSLVNSLYRNILEEDCYLSGDTLYCEFSFDYDDRSYEEVFTSMLIFQGDFIIEVETFIYKYSNGETVNMIYRNNEIVDWSLPILPLENDLFELYNYILENMTPSDLQVYTHMMVNYDWGEDVEEFQDEFFFGLLIKGYQGGIDRKRFHYLMDLYIRWSVEKGETEKPDHFLFFKELFPIHDFGTNDLTPIDD